MKQTTTSLHQSLEEFKLGIEKLPKTTARQQKKVNFFKRIGETIGFYEKWK